MLRSLSTQEISLVAGGMEAYDDFGDSEAFSGGDWNSGGDVGGGGGGYYGGDFGDGGDVIGGNSADFGDGDTGPVTGREAAQASGAALGGYYGAEFGPAGAVIGGLVGLFAGNELNNLYQNSSAENVHYQYIQYNSLPGGQYYHDFN